MRRPLSPARSLACRITLCRASIFGKSGARMRSTPQDNKVDRAVTCRFTAKTMNPRSQIPVKLLSKTLTVSSS